MDLQVLLATMNQNDHSLLDRMNIQSDAIIANQTDKYDMEEFKYRDHKIRWFSFAERGVGLNRNNALMRANADISVIADDDMIYVDNYREIIKEEFERYPKADVIIFNLIEEEPERYVIKKPYKVGYTNYMRFGAARIAFKTKSITKNNIFFNMHFGGGNEHSAGEDVLFLTECLKKGLNIMAVPVSIAYLSEVRESTWFKGYTDKFFKDKGVLFYYISKRWAYLLCLQFAIRYRQKFKKKRSVIEVFKIMVEGIKREQN